MVKWRKGGGETNTETDAICDAGGGDEKNKRERSEFNGAKNQA